VVAQGHSCRNPS